jgi:hypothetical protein
MPDNNILALRQADQARTDFALIESNLEFLAGQLARVPTRGDLATFRRKKQVFGQGVWPGWHRTKKLAG